MRTVSAAGCCGPSQGQGWSPSMIFRENNETFGADPRSMTVEQLNALGHEKRPKLKVMRAKCLDCCGDQPSEVLKCSAIDCDNWPYRMGTDPFTKRTGNVGNLK